MNNLINKRFDRLIVLEKTDKRIGGYVIWKCLCDCGNIKEIRSSDLKRKNVRSCGCLAKESARLMGLQYGKKSKTHGLAHTPIYNIWCTMKARCTNPNHIGYDIYGGRGIKVCNRWMKFENFYKDMKSGYSDSLTIDRIDNNGNYEPSNCRWATHKQQANNTRGNHLFEYRGKIKNIKEWSEEFNMNYSKLYSRLLKYNWSIERAFERRAIL